MFKRSMPEWDVPASPLFDLSPFHLPYNLHLSQCNLTVQCALIDDVQQ